MQLRPNRRQFVKKVFTLGAGAAAGAGYTAGTSAERRTLPEATPAKLPPWRGFNLLEKFNAQNEPFKESDFAWLAELGFNFVRLPMDYRGWIEGGDWTKLRESTLKEIDAAVEYGVKYGIHVCINFHRAPGYTVARPPEPLSVWKDDEALRVCAFHWSEFARRHAGVPNRQLSFNLFNEPGNISREDYHRVVARIVGEIRKHDSKRLVICDGRGWGRTVPEELLELGVAGSTRGYEPMQISHYQASWIQGSDRWPTPTYPLTEGTTQWNRSTLRERLIQPWKALQANGMGVVVGEFGAYNRTPHPVVLAWLEDCLALWKEAGWGWAMWNFRGPFGILDSGRSDVQYEDWHGHKLDRTMLNLLQKYLPNA